MAITLDGSTNNIAIGANATGSSFLRLYEDTDNGSNYIDLIAPSAVGSNRVLTLPDSTTTIVGTDAAQTLTNKTLGSGLVMSVSTLTSGTSVTASGTSVNFTGIPSWVKRITVMFSGVSTNGTSIPLVQIGDSGGVENTGYLGTTSYFSGVGVASVNNTTGFLISNGAGEAATAIRHGQLLISKLTDNTWVCSGSIGLSDQTRSSLLSYSKELSATLDRVRITTVNGTDTFDAGTINIMYE